MNTSPCRALTCGAALFTVPVLIIALSFEFESMTNLARMLIRASVLEAT